MKYSNICVLAIVICGLVLSGCTDKKDTSSELTSEISPANDTATADAILAEGNASITDTEIQDMDKEMKELEVLIVEMEKENITIEEI
ncbi:hypothetical protein [uncultured Methanomethylovorans sp.]|uniref:hypothetical protein n=1 Tax=uncultured Methanomethylovorans sp. TaxID=183759 RepID=UPI002AA6AFA5|nr:hypothetical protein [uncultured Methanomethylovorans sp.]